MVDRQRDNANPPSKVADSQSKKTVSQEENSGRASTERFPSMNEDRPDENRPNKDRLETTRLDPAEITLLYHEHADQLQRFLFGILRDSATVADVLQTTFVKLTEVGHKTQEDSRKAWLFRVAYHEALAIKRRSKIKQKAEEKLSWINDSAALGSDLPVVHQETLEQVRQAIDELPTEIKQVVRMRMYEDKTFAVISEELKIPLGTALGRMRNGLAKLKSKLQQVNQNRQK